MNMNDRDWLDRVWTGYKVYKEEVLYHEQALEHFILWLYKQYGIVPPTERTKEKQ